MGLANGPSSTGAADLGGRTLSSSLLTVIVDSLVRSRAQMMPALLVPAVTIVTPLTRWVGFRSALDVVAPVLPPE